MATKKETSGDDKKTQKKKTTVKKAVPKTAKKIAAKKTVSKTASKKTSAKTVKKIAPKAAARKTTAKATAPKVETPKVKAKTTNTNKNKSDKSSTDNDFTLPFELPNIKNLSDKLWRLIAMVAFALLGSFAFHAFIIITAIQYVMVFLTDKKNEEVAAFLSSLKAYFLETLDYISFEREEMPFPFSPFPSEHKE